MKEWHFFDKVYRTYVIVVNGTGEQFAKFLKDDCSYTDRVDDLNLEHSTGYLIDMNSENNDAGNTCLIMWLPKQKLPTLVHELAHLCDFVFSDKGIPMRRENTEAYAYYLEHWFIEITELWKTHPNGRNSKQLEILKKQSTVGAKS